MQMKGIPFMAVDWAGVERVEYPGEVGVAYWQTRQFGDIRVRMVEYSPGYVADHWCSKGHVILCLDGELVIELEDGRQSVLPPGMSCQVGDNEPAAHRSVAPKGAKIFIVD